MAMDDELSDCDRWRRRTVPESDLDNRIRRVVLPEEAVTRVKILEASDPPDHYRISMMDGREVWAAVPRDEYFDVGKEAEVLLEFDSTEFKVIPSRVDTAELGVWPESQGDGRVSRYRYIGRIQGMYDWHVERGFSGSAFVGLIVLLDVGFPLTVRFEFESLTSKKAYFGFSDYISGVGWFDIVDAGTMRNYVRYVKGPPWRMRSAEFRFIEDEVHRFPSPPIPSKAERKKIRKEARAPEDEFV